MAKIKIKRQQVVTMGLILGVAIIIISLLQISPMSLRNFDQVCQKFNYAECMTVYWKQRAYYIKWLYGGGIITILTVGMMLNNKLRKNK